MRPQHRTSTTRLPQSLREQIEAQEGLDTPQVLFLILIVSLGLNNDRPHNLTVHRALNRKELRKTGRQEIQQRKAQHFSRQSDTHKRHPTTPTQYPPAKKRKISSDDDAPNHVLVDALQKDSPQSLRLEPSSLQAKSSKPPKTAKAKRDHSPLKLLPVRSRREEDEDAYINMLELKLGINKSRNGESRYGSAFKDDGLLGS